MIPALLTAFCLVSSPVSAREPPEPAIALSMSLVIGFGAGHFYARRPGVGAVFALGEGAALGTALAQFGRETPDEGALATAIVVGAIFRAAEVLSAPVAARNARQYDIWLTSSMEGTALRTTRLAQDLVSKVYSDLERVKDAGFDEAVERATAMLEAGSMPGKLRQEIVEYLRAHPEASVAEGFSASATTE